MNENIDYGQGMNEFANVNPEALNALMGSSNPAPIVDDSPLIAAARNPYDVSSTPRHEVLNFEGTPTQFSDDTGLRAILTKDGIFDVNSFNPIVKPGEKITADTARQAHNEENQLLFLDDQGNPTTRNTGVPMVGGTIGDAAYMKEQRGGGGVFGPILSDFTSMAKDPQFHKFLLTAAAIGTGGLAANAAFGVGGLGAAGGMGAGLGPVATAYPVTGGALIPGVELGAAGMGGAGSLTAGITPASVSAFEAALPATMGEIGGLATPAALTPEAATSLLEGLTTEQASNLMKYGLLPSELQVPAAGAGLAGLTGADALKYAKLAGGVASALGGGSGSGTPAAGGNYGSYGTGGGGALPGNLASTTLPGSSVAMLDPFKDYNKFEQIRAVQDDQDMRSIPISEPLYAASGGDVTSLAQIQERLSQLDPRLNSVLQNKLKANYYTYGSDSSGGLPTQLMNSQLGAKPNPGYPAQAASNAKASLYDTYGFKPASLNQQEKAPETVYAKDGGHIPEFITGATGHYVKGRGDGQSDSIPAMLADGEYVFDAETVAQLGNGSSDAGAKILDRMRQNIREHKRSAPVDKIPPKSKSPLEYMAESKRK